MVEPVETFHKIGHGRWSTTESQTAHVLKALGYQIPMAYTYIVRCSDGSYYVGSTFDLDRRIKQHNLGHGARYTAKRRPVVLAWAAEYDSVRDAFLVEKQIQNWSRDKREALIEGRLHDLPPLSRGRTGRRDRDT